MVVTLVGRYGYEVPKTGVTKIKDNGSHFSLIYINGDTETFNKKNVTYTVTSNKEN